MSIPTTAHTFPDQAQLEAFAADAAADDGPVVMLNLNRYRPVAQYAEGMAPAEDEGREVSGREVYLRYGIVAQQALEAVGGKVLWMTEASAPIIGCDHDAYEEVLAVWYPNRAAFLALTDVPGYVDALQHRDAALERAAILPCASGPS